MQYGKNNKITLQFINHTVWAIFRHRIEILPLKFDTLKKYLWWEAASWYGVSFWADKNALKLVVMATQPCEYMKKPLNYTLKDGEFMVSELYLS